MLEEVYTHRFGCYLVVADRAEGASIGGVDQQQYYGDAYARYQHREYRVSVCRILTQHVGSVGDRAEGVPLEEGSQYLGKSECRYSEVVGLEPQHRYPDKKGDDRDYESGSQYRDQHSQIMSEDSEASLEHLDYGPLYDAAVKVLIDCVMRSGRYGEYGVSVCSDEHESSLTEREQACEAVQQVHRRRD